MRSFMAVSPSQGMQSWPAGRGSCSSRSSLPRGAFSDAASSAYVSDFMSSSEGVQLTKAFVRIKNGKVRRRIIDLVESLAEEDGGNA